jgi:hypothetical protein
MGTEPLGFLPDNLRVRRSLKMLDETLPRECHKVGVVFAGRGQDSERALLMNTRGSSAYEAFLSTIGWEVDLASHRGFMGKLDPLLTTGTHSVYFADRMVEMMYHVVSMMPTSVTDEQQLHIKRQVGNDHVHIVWCEDQRDYRPNTIMSYFNHVHIVIYPLKDLLGERKATGSGGVDAGRDAGDAEGDSASGADNTAANNGGERGEGGTTGEGGESRSERDHSLFRIQIFQKSDVPQFGPLRNGMVVSRALLGPLVRLTALNACRACRRSTQGYKLPYPTRMEQIDVLTSRFNTQMNPADFLGKLFAGTSASE